MAIFPIAGFTAGGSGHEKYVGIQLHDQEYAPPPRKSRGPFRGQQRPTSLLPYAIGRENDLAFRLVFLIILNKDSAVNNPVAWRRWQALVRPVGKHIRSQRRSAMTAL